MPKISSKRQITLPVEQCLELGINPGDEYQSFVADGHITIVKKKPGAAEGVLKHIVANASISDEESLQSALFQGARLIAIDTNVLLRYLLWDDEAQAAKAKLLINGPQPVLLTDIVLVETVWTLTGKKYQLDKSDVLALLNSLLEEPNIFFEDGQTVWRAINDYRQAKQVNVGGKQNAAGFPDALIVNKGKFCIAQKHESFGGVYTFDIAAQQIPGTKCP